MPQSVLILRARLRACARACIHLCMQSMAVWLNKQRKATVPFVPPLFPPPRHNSSISPAHPNAPLHASGGRQAAPPSLASPLKAPHPPRCSLGGGGGVPVVLMTCRSPCARSGAPTAPPSQMCSPSDRARPARAHGRLSAAAPVLLPSA